MGVASLRVSGASDEEFFLSFTALHLDGGSLSLKLTKGGAHGETGRLFVLAIGFSVLDSTNDSESGVVFGAGVFELVSLGDEKILVAFTQGTVVKGFARAGVDIDALVDMETAVDLEE